MPMEDGMSNGVLELLRLKKTVLLLYINVDDHVGTALLQVHETNPYEYPHRFALSLDSPKDGWSPVFSFFVYPKIIEGKDKKPFRSIDFVLEIHRIAKSSKPLLRKLTDYVHRSFN